MDPFTHTFDFNFGTVSVSGDVVFDAAGNPSMNIKQAGVPLKADILETILEFLRAVGKIYVSGGSVSMIRVKAKAV